MLTPDSNTGRFANVGSASITLVEHAVFFGEIDDNRLEVLGLNKVAVYGSVKSVPGSTSGPSWW
jgi:hypothetical protein